MFSDQMTGRETWWRVIEASPSQHEARSVDRHIDVVEAKRSDWTTDPFQFIEKDDYFYGRGTQDMKDSDAAMVESFIRLRREASSLTATSSLR